MSDTPTAQILIVEDEPDHAEVMAEALRRLGHICTTAHSLKDAEQELRYGAFDLVVTDLKMVGEEDGLEVLALATQYQAHAEVIMVTAHGDIPTAKRALKGGAYEFIEKPLELDVFRTICTRAIETVFANANNRATRKKLDKVVSFEGILGQSQAINQVISQLKLVAPSDIPILVTGPSGTGKELVAQALHNQSQRTGARFVPLNCAGLSESILEDELFGHVKGAYTGADTDREGRFEYAHGGTLFLDEVGDMPLPMQAKLLRVLESGEVVRVGDNAPRHVDVRVVSATNRDLRAMVKTGTFREDLFYRLAGIQITLPALQNRKDDIPVLAQHFLAQFAEKMNRDIPSIDEKAHNALISYTWPGNIRQLRNVMQNTLILTPGNTLEIEHLPPEFHTLPLTNVETETSTNTENEAEILAKNIQPPASTHHENTLNTVSLSQLEKQAIRQALAEHNGNREAAAAALGIGERTLYRKIKEHGIQ